MKKCVLVAALLGVMAIATPSHAIVPVKTMLAQLDTLRKLTSDVSSKVSIVQSDVNQGEKVMEAVYFAKDLDDQFLIVMTKPESEKGNGYLKIGKNFWMYRRNTRTFQHVGRDESVAGSNANAGDFEAPKYALQYQSQRDANGNEMVATDILGKIPVYRFTVTSTVPDIDYPKKTLWLRQDNLLPLKEQSFSSSGTLMQTQYYLKYSEMDGRFIPVKQLIVDEFEKGNKTMWEITQISFGKLSHSQFTKGYLENLSK